MPSPKDQTGFPVFSIPPTLVVAENRRAYFRTTRSDFSSPLRAQSDHSFPPSRKTSPLSNSHSFRSPSSEAAAWEGSHIEITGIMGQGSADHEPVRRGSLRNPETGEVISAAIKLGCDPAEIEMHSAVAPFGQPSASGIIARLPTSSPLDLITPECDFMFSDIKTALIALIYNENEKYGLYSSFISFSILHHLLSCMIHAFSIFAQKSITHGDVKPENIGYRGNFVLIDLGSAKKLSDLSKEYSEHGLNCSPYYLACEFYAHLKNNRERLSMKAKRDIYALGLTVLEVTEGRLYLDILREQRHQSESILELKAALFQEQENPKKHSLKFQKKQTADYLNQIKKWNLKKDDLREIFKILGLWMIEALPECRPTIPVLMLAADKLLKMIHCQLQQSGLSKKTLYELRNTFYEEQRQIKLFSRLEPQNTRTKRIETDTLRTDSAFTL